MTDKSVHSLFEAQAQSTPDAEAVRFEGVALSYAQLNARANRLAHRLRALGVGPDSRVGLCAARGLDMAVAVLGILKAGGAYVPLDPTYPAERLRLMLENADARVLVTQESLRPLLPPHPQTLCLDTDGAWEQDASNPAHQTQIDHLCYVIYTSGSTGVPKGVALSHGALHNLTLWQLENSPLGPGDRTLQFASLSFDVSFQEMFATWASGGTLVLIPEDLRRDPRGLLRLIEREGVARLFLPFVALQQLAEGVRSGETVPQSLREIMTAGEQLQITPKIAAFFAKSNGCVLHNQYGPSETHVVTQYTLTGPPETWPALPPIGVPIASTTVHVLDDAQQPTTPGEEGELYLGGAGLARGYLGRPDLTDERFPTIGGARLYKTGDRARVLPSGDLEFLGRMDGQVKVRGFRIETAEVEHALAQHPHVKQCAVIAQDDSAGKALVAYVVTDNPTDAADLRSFLQASLPPYMVPSRLVFLDALPLTPSGKVDRRALPTQVAAERPTPAAPARTLTQTLSALWQSILGTRPAFHDNFFDIGGTSLHMTQVQQGLADLLGREVDITTLFQYPTIAALAAYLAQENVSEDAPVSQSNPARADTKQNASLDAIAIVGMAGRFPGAENIDQFWDNLTQGVESITRFTDDELRAAGVPDALIANPDYVKARAVLERSEWFDAAFFGMTPREAEVTDPQHRVFLECAWEALERAGYDPSRYSGAIGVYAGLSWNTYLLHNLLADRRTTEEITGDHQVGHYPILTGNDKDYLTTRVSYKMNLRGPSVSVQTGCSTSLVAVCQAVAALQGGQCDMALAGGVSVSFPQMRGYVYQEGGMVSPDGHCRAFDAGAAGTVFGGGAGIVVLKRLTEAIEDGDTIYAVVRGAALNNDGAGKVSYTAPSVDGQADVISKAHASANVSPNSITYVETHGTGTPLGDPIEVAGLTQAFRRGTARTGYCAIGSVKANIGHLEAAAGVTGLIKTALALTHKTLPPSLHYTQPNPRIDFARSPFFVNAALTEWAATDTPRRAGVSSFGVGGTNAHVVVEEAPVVAPRGPARPWQLLPLSARTEAALETMTGSLAAHLARPDVGVADAAYTLAVGRKAFGHRRVAVCSLEEDAGAVLTGASDPKRVWTGTAPTQDTPVVFMFPGQGAQQVNMGRELYDHEPVFRECVDTCAALLQPPLGLDIRDVLYPAPGHEDDAQQTLTQTGVTQPALFVVEYALARLWMSWGIVPAAMIGHSVGEYVAACLSGVFTLPDALAVLAARARFMQRMPSGAMLAVRLPESDVRPLLGANLSIAAINSPALCVVSGPNEDADALQALLEAKGTVCRRLHTSHAFHSAMMDGALAPFAEIVASVPRQAPQIPYVSNLTAEWATEAQATDPQYWANHLRQAVRFADGVGFLLSQEPSYALLEVGPGQTLTSLARQHPAKTSAHTLLASLDTNKNTTPELAAILTALGRLWVAGCPVDWRGVYAREQRRRIPLPTYPFERTRHWVEPVHALQSTILADEPAPPAAQGAEAVRDGYPSGDAMPQTLSTAPVTESRTTRITAQLSDTLHQISGVPKDALDPQASFLELGFDSLFLTQASQAFGSQFGVKITFRNLLEDTPSLATLAAFLDGKLPPEAVPAPAVPAAPVAAPAPVPASSAPVPPVLSRPGTPLPAPARADVPASGMERILAQQLLLMTEQLALLRGVPGAAVETGSPVMDAPAGPQPEDASPHLPAPVVTADAPPAIPAPEAKPFGPFKPIEKGLNGALTERQQAHLDTLIARTVAQTPGSKRYAAEHRKHLSDPRVVAGFKSAWKEMVYPVVVERSAGSRLWDVDGHEWLDITMGFGVNLFGHAPKFVADAVQAQMAQGVEIGPQAPLAGIVAKQICAMTGLDRVTFCNTGSEAVMAALRAARTVTGRNKIVYFTGDYHGTFDEVLARANHIDGKLQSAPIAPGIPPGMVQDTLIVDYGTPDALALVAAHAHELAAVLVEPVQSRRPDLQPAEFLHALRRITQEAGAALIFDEVITGFRIHPGGAQAHFGVQADIATYGKVIGGGMPFGVVAGRAEFMDAFDGGAWQYGDDSFPEAGVTFFAGTFVRHPLALAAAQAVLTHLETHGPALQDALNARTAQFVSRVNAKIDARGVPMRLANFGSLFYFKFAPELKWASLLFYELRAQGIHVWEGRPCFLSTAHSDDDIERLVQAFESAVIALQNGGFFPAPPEDGPQTPLGTCPRPALIGHPSPFGKGEGLVAKGGLASHSGAEPQNVSPLAPLPCTALTPLAPLPAAGGGVAEGRGGGHIPTDVQRLCNGLATNLLRPHDSFTPDNPPPQNDPVTLPLTDAQREVWLAAQMGDAASCALIESIYIHLRGPLDIAALQDAAQALPLRHEALRTTFAPDGASQTVHPAVTLDVPLVDLSPLADAERDAALLDLLAREGQMPFALEHGPLVRAQIVRLGDAHHVFVFSAHHLVCDGWSSGLLLSELGALYESAIAGTAADLPAPASLRAYVAGQQEHAGSAEAAGEEAWWQAQLTPLPSPLAWPLDTPRPTVNSYRGAMLTRAIGPELTTSIRALGAKHGCTLLATLLAGYAAFLRRLTGQDDFVVGIPAAGQSLEANTALVGHCVNLLPVRVTPDADAPFDAFLTQTRRSLLDALDHQTCTFSRLLPALPGARQGGQTPLVSTTFNVDRLPSGLSFGPLAWDVQTSPRSFFQFDLSLNVVEAGAGLLIECHYNTDLFDADTVACWLGHWETLLAGAVSDPALPVSRLPLLTDAERAALLAAGTNAAAVLPTQTIQGLFEAQAAATPDVVVLVFDTQTVTYAQLNARANRLAHHLRARGVGGDAPVGLCAERSPEMIVALLAILKAGGAYLPLDPAFPPERLSLMLADAGVRLVLTQPALAARLPEGVPLLCLTGDEGESADASDSNLMTNTGADNLAYVLYTSGSTGVPKGVCIPHRGVVRLVQGADYAEFGPEEVFLQMAPLSFDASTFEIWGALLNGGRLVLMPPTSPGLSEIGEAIARHGITTLWLTAGLFHLMVDEKISALRPLRQLLAGGDALSVPHVRRVREALPHLRLINGYGPTECTTFACCHTVRDADCDRPSIPIGRPIAGTTALVLDAQRNIVPPGVEGELYLGGDGLAQGYLNQPALTAERFVLSPFADGGRLYKTGDRARVLPSGDLEFLGRMDGQVKVRGFRIETAEVEHALARHSRVKQCVVAAQEDGAGKTLVAYVVTDSPTDAADLRGFLASSLPPYMVPSRFMPLDALPLTPNGKVDRRALPVPAPDVPAVPAPDAMPPTDIERRLSALWQDVLGTAEIGLHDNFFDLGGHSLLAVRLFVQIEKTFGQRLPLPALFQAPTIAQMASLLHAPDAPAVAASAILVPIQTGGTKPPLFCVHHIDGIVVCYGDLARHLGPAQPVYGLQAPALMGEAPPPARVEDMAAQYVAEIVRAHPAGPYRLCGLSFGGTVAFAMACQMRAQGLDVDFVGLLDTYAPAYFRSEYATEGERPLLQRTMQQWDTFRRMKGAQGALVATKARSAIKRLRDVLPASARAVDQEVADYLPSVLQAVRGANEAAQAGYFPAVYPGQVTLLRAQERLDKAYNDPLLSWGGLADGIAVREVPGNHYTLVKEPFVRALASALQGALSEAGGD